MNFFRLSIPAAVLSLGGCSFSTAPEPPEFKLTAEALNQQYSARRETEAGRLYAGEIATARDDEGRRTYRATGGALYVIDAVPPIQVMAPEISITPDFSETLGKATVKKDDRLYIGYETTKFRVEGTTLKPDGAHLIRRIAVEKVPVNKSAAPEAGAAATSPTVAEPAALPPPKPVNRKAVSESKARKSSPPRADKPKEAPAVDRPRLLNLMREPTER